MLYALAGTIIWSRCQDEAVGAMAFNLNVCLRVVVGLAHLGIPPAEAEENFYAQRDVLDMVA